MKSQDFPYADAAAGRGEPFRILDLDLDFFVHGAAHRRIRGERHDAAEFPPWSLESALSFLRERCLLEQALPGIVVENHGELFHRWGEAIDDAVIPPQFHVTHIDAHADLGLGDAGYIHLMSELLYRAPTDRRSPRKGEDGLGDGNYLAFAVANRWLSALTYVYNDEGGGDLMWIAMESFDEDASNLQLAAMQKQEIDKLLGIGGRKREAKIDRLEPPVPFAHLGWRSFQASAPFDFICLARSPAFTPQESDLIFEEIRNRFISES